MHNYKLIGESQVTDRSYDKLEDVTEYLTSDSLTETENNISKVLSYIQSWLRRKLKATVQSQVTGFFKMSVSSSF